ncbi:MAG: YifB family Mg chelatase-like AAA ATPase [Pseudohongiellaceae bacterium]
MSIATVYSRALLGVEAIEVTVETHLSAGLPGFAIVGLPEAAVKESKERVRSAILNSGLEFPAQRITVNLAPADIPKSGGRYDLAIALGILAASGQIPVDKLNNQEVLGELALDGEVRRVQGALPAILAAQQEDRGILLPAGNCDEIDLAGYERTQAVGHLNHYIDHVVNNSPLRQKVSSNKRVRNPGQSQCTDLADFSDCKIHGQALAKRAIQIAAAGGHNLLMIGPPGCGKTLLAQVMVRLLPALNTEQALEIAAIRSVASLSVAPHDWWQRPLRAPHHSATAVALVGGGNRARPGEISLAHRGVLFLDELAEFKPSVLDCLREPLESGHITISRANYQVVFPADFQLLAAMNPCPCGHANDPRVACRCPPDRVERYLGKLSGPLLDRIDLIVEMASLTQAELLSTTDNPDDWPAAQLAVAECQQRQYDTRGKLNRALLNRELERYCPLSNELQAVLAGAMDKLNLSARTVHRIIRVARTIADLRQADALSSADLLEAIAFRRSPVVQKLAA